MPFESRDSRGRDDVNLLLVEENVVVPRGVIVFEKVDG